METVLLALTSPTGQALTTAALSHLVTLLSGKEPSLADIESFNAAVREHRSAIVAWNEAKHKVDDRGPLI